MSDVSAVTHLLPTVNEGFITTVGGSGVTSGGTTVPLTSVTNLSNGTTFVGIIEPGADKQQVFTGTVDTGASAITGVVWTRGTNVAHAAGVTVVDYVSGTAFNMMAKWAATEHKDDGTHGAITADSATVSGTVSANTVTVPHLTVSSSLSLPADSVTSAMLNPTVSTEANGWSVLDFGGWTEYHKYVTWSGSASLGSGDIADVNFTGSWPAAFGTTWPAKAFISYGSSTSDRAIAAIIDVPTPSTSIATRVTGHVQNNYLSALTATAARAYIRILVLP